MPATAAARSTATTSSLNRASRRSTTAATAVGTAAGATSSRPELPMSWPNSHTNNGFPPLRSTTASTAEVDLPLPTEARNSSPAASGDSRGTATDVPARVNSATCWRSSS